MLLICIMLVHGHRFIYLLYAHVYRYVIASRLCMLYNMSSKLCFLISGLYTTIFIVVTGHYITRATVLALLSLLLFIHFLCTCHFTFLPFSSLTTHSSFKHSDTDKSAKLLISSIAPKRIFVQKPLCKGMGLCKPCPKAGISGQLGVFLGGTWEFYRARLISPRILFQRLESMVKHGQVSHCL